MTPINIITLLITGTFTGFISGLLGVGGGIVMTPVQYIVYSNMGLSTDTAIKLTFGTTMLVILPTAISGAWRHYQQGAVQKRVVPVMGGCGLVAAFGGAAIAAHLPGSFLKIAFGVIILGSLVRMLTVPPRATEKKLKDAPWLWAIWSVVVGLISGILGVGGGIMMIPVLVLVLGLRMHEAVATSLAVMVFTGIGGSLGYIINGLTVTNLPAYSLGFVYLPAWFLLSVTSISMAQIGAVTAHRLPANHLRYMFMIVLFYLGLKMTGIFDLLGLPI